MDALSNTAKTNKKEVSALLDTITTNYGDNLFRGKRLSESDVIKDLKGLSAEVSCDLEASTMSR